MDPSSSAASTPWIRRETLLPLLAAWLVAFTCRAPLVAAGPLLPVIRQALHLDGTVASLLTALPLFMMALASLPGGWLGDRIGPERGLFWGEIVLLGGVLLRVVGSTSTPLLLGTALMGVGIGVAQPALAQIARTIAPRHVGAATAVYTNGLMLGSVAATFLAATWLLPAFHAWRWALAAWALPAVPAIVVWASRPLRAEPPAITEGLPRFRLKNYRGVFPLMVSFGAQSVVFYGLVTWLSAYYVSHGWSVSAASVPTGLLAVGSLAGALLSPVLARTWDGVRPPMVMAGASAAASVAGFLLWPPLGPVWALFAGSSTALAFTLGLHAAPVLADRHDAGRLTGTVMAIGYAASLIGPLSIGSFLAAVGSYRPGFGVLLFASLVIAVAGARLPHPLRGRAAE